MTPPSEQPDASTLPSTLHQADQCIEHLGADFSSLSRRFSELCTRFSEGRFHLAVLGQFKRGKSTFVNAMCWEKSCCPQYFEKQNTRLTELISKRMDMVLKPHQARADELIETLRQTAANLFEIPYHAPRSDKAFTLSRRPYWLTRRWSTRLNPLPMSLGDSLFSNGRQRLQKRLREQSRELTLANVENLRWSLFQSIDDTFRRFSTTLAERLRETKSATQEATRAAADRRRNQGETISRELSRLETAVQILEKLQKILLDD